jgi:class 3 adenylate cyclase
LHYLHVRIVARSGATQQARKLYEEYAIGARTEDLDARTLDARILKDKALKSREPKRQARLGEAAQRYHEVFDQLPDSYPAVNAATLYFLAGRREEADALARATLDACAKEDPQGDWGVYFHAATVAEASLLVGDLKSAEEYIRRAGEIEAVDYATRTTTRKQLKLICETTRTDMAILDAIRVPGVLYFAGHIIGAPGKGGRFPAVQEDHVQDEIERYLDEHDVGVAFGSLAAGADIMISEACIRRNIDVHAVLPFNKADFYAESVAAAEAGWSERFEECFAWCEANEAGGSGSIQYATDGSFLGDESLFMYAARFAMGLAMLRARNLDTDLRMLAIYDGKGGTGIGTDGSIDVWAAAGLPCDVIDVQDSDEPRTTMDGVPGARPARPSIQLPEREPRAILFGDVVGFSSLDEEMVPLFHDCFMSRVSAVLDDYKEHVLYRNSWGDAVYVVLDHALTAASCGLAIQKVVRRHDFRDDGINTDLSLRLGGHFGPVFCGKDYIRKEPTYFGSHVTKAARIEPVTPPGELYVTEAMAAALALSENDTIDCDYVGPVPLAKNYGELRMYVLRERA